MWIEAFTEAKTPDDASSNEDQLLILPGRGYAVIDGVSARTGHRYDGLTAGQVAARTVQQATASFLLDPSATALDPAELIQRIAHAIRDAYQRHGILSLARQEPARRFGATLALAAEGDGFWRFILIGDSGVRLNGSELWRNDTGLDQVTASLRQAAYRLVANAGGTPDDQVLVGRACVFHGAAQLHPDMRPWLDEALLQEMRAGCLTACRSRFPNVPVSDIERLLDGGILSGQGDFQNNTASPLSYAVLDGFETPMALVQVIDREHTTVSSIELFTDGYFAMAETPSIKAWEASFREVERSDPDKIDRYPSPKGSTASGYADDRTVIVIHRQ
ncbi:MAG: protein phosphatase 2C domain-containing protein [Alphaproteobacteria bacterium]|nr:protein phosphatase 2C domain-containing protein [Alphaproteobacteria bacterium]